jgi:methylase of polypeptide subunit release factors
MTKLWYNDDEVKKFHPIVETCLNNALVKLQKSNIAEVVHHPSIPNSSIIPDFGIRLKGSKRFIFIIEVKRTKRDVDSQRYCNQARSYVQDFGTFWETGYHKYFCVSNIEKTILFADRTGQTLNNCVVSNNPFTNTDFDTLTKDATVAIKTLEKSFETILEIIFSRQPPEWNNQWLALTDIFYNQYQTLQAHLVAYPEDIRREVSLYELFRLWCYSYLNDFYAIQNDNNKTSYFRLQPNQKADIQQVKTTLSNNFARIMQLDFKQIFSNHPNSNERIFPEKLDSTIAQNFKNLILETNQYMKQAIKSNPSPSYIFSLLTSKIYEKAELHKKGKVMSDAELANILATLCIDNQKDTILDPCCGDGALLDAAYDFLQLMNLNATHNETLNRVHGIEIDPFLSQLATFRLLSKKLADVNNQTEAKIRINDVFDIIEKKTYNVVLMNPPFLRNDNPDAPITEDAKEKMFNAIRKSGVKAFVDNAKQANLYFYFSNYAWHFLKDEGKAGFILMTKFLNNEDGEFLKDFFKDKAEAIISYPYTFFSGFRVSTVIVILRKSLIINSEIAFLRVKDTQLLENPNEIKKILALKRDQFRSDFNIKWIERKDIAAKENWKLYFQDPEQKNQKVNELSFFKPLNHFFKKIKRGAAENNGGSDIIFPKDKSIEPFSNIDPFLFRFGLRNSKAKRKFILTENDLNLEKAIHFPAEFEREEANGLADYDIENYEGISDFFDTQITNFGFEKWGKIVNAAFNSQVKASIILPRAERAKHSVHFNPFDSPIVLSTNFFYLGDAQNFHPDIEEVKQMKFFVAYLLSSFGQIQYELNANNQEGLRKLEGFQVQRFQVPDISQITENQIDSVVFEFEKLNKNVTNFCGDEGVYHPRHDLNMAFAEIIFAENTLSFSSSTEMCIYFELFLADLVEDRKL